MSAKTTLRQLLKRGEFVWSPCIYDCVSAKVAQLCGYNAILLSSCELEYSMNGIPAGLYNWEEYIWATERIAHSSDLPLIVDAENGGGTPLQVYRNCKRLAEAGAMGISIEDTLSGTLFCGYHYGHPRGYMDGELWAANIKAAVDAVKGTDCMIIARTDCKGGGAPQVGAIGGSELCLGLDEAIRRCKMGVEAGAEITMIQNICHADCEEECRRVAAEIPGWHFYPDVHATDGVPDATFEQLKEWGFHLVSNHAAMKGATKGMMEYMSENFKNKNTIYSENDEFMAWGISSTPSSFRNGSIWTAIIQTMRRHCAVSADARALEKAELPLGIKRRIFYETETSNQCDAGMCDGAVHGGLRRDRHVKHACFHGGDRGRVLGGYSHLRRHGKDRCDDRPFIHGGGHHGMV